MARQWSHHEQKRSITPVYAAKQGVQQHLNLVLLDTSGSTLNAQGLRDALGAVKHLYQQTYLQRHQFALIGFGNQEVNWLIRPQKANKTWQHRIGQVQAGGGTPLVEALNTASQFAQKYQRSHPHRSLNFYLITDGLISQEVAALPLPGSLHVIDTERGAVKLGKAKAIAQRLNAHYQHIDTLHRL